MMNATTDPYFGQNDEDVALLEKTLKVESCACKKEPIDEIEQLWALFENLEWECGFEFTETKEEEGIVR